MSINIQVKFLATYREFLPSDSEGNSAWVEVAPGTTVREFITSFGVPSDEASVFLVNGHTPKPCQKLVENDVVTVFPAMAGGSILEQIRRIQ